MANLVLTMAAGMTAVAFGANTLGGEGALPAPSGATLLMTGTAGGYTQTGGAGGPVAPTSDGSADPGTLVFDNGTTWNATVPANTYHFTDTAELQNAIADNGTTGGTEFIMRDGSDALTTQTTISTSFASEVTIKAENDRAATLGLFLISGDNIKLDGLRFQGDLDDLYVLEITAAASNLTLDYCHISGTQDVTAWDFATNGSQRLPSGIGPNLNNTNITIRGCWFENLRRGAILSGDPISIRGCWFENCGDAFINIPIGDNLEVIDCVGQGLYSHSADAGGAHAAVGPGWGGTGTCTSYDIIGNRFFVTDRRFENQGDYHADGVRGLAFDYPGGGHSGISTHHNISVGSNGTAEMEGITSGNIYNNTFMNDPLAGGANRCVLTVSGLGTGLLVANNIGLPSKSGAQVSGFYKKCFKNAGSVGSAGLSGSHDVAIDMDNYLTELTPVSGSFMEELGAIQPDFTFATGVGTRDYVPHVDNSSIPTIPETATTTGQVIAGYDFDGVTERLSGPSMTITGNHLTIMMGFELTDDTDDCYPLDIDSALGSTYLRRLASGNMILNTNNVSGHSLNVASDGWQAAAGAQNVIILIDGDTGELTIYVNGYRCDITEGSGATRWVESLTLGATNIGLMGTTSGGGIATGKLSYFWMDDVLLDLDGSQTILDAVCAQDGGAPNFDADGGIASAGISQPQIYIHAGNPNGIEDNLGNKGAAGDFAVTGTPTAPA